MKKNTKVTIAVALIGLIAIGNKDYVLACKSQTEAEEYLGKVHSKAEDLLGMIHKSNQELCNKATKTQSK